MTKSNSAMDHRGSTEAGLTTKRRQAGTTLVEILVVIVIFLIGILAVVQVFPRGFRLLLTTRNNSMATALGRDAIERLKSNPDLIPDEVVPVRYSGGTPVVDSTINPLALGPLGDAIDAAGKLTNGGGAVSNDWKLAAGPNVARRIIGEGHRLPVPRTVGAVSSGSTRYDNYGGLLVVDHNPVDSNGPMLAYANDLSRTIGAPRESQLGVAVNLASANGDSVQLMSADGSTVIGTIPANMVATPVTTAPYEFFVTDPGTSQAAVLLPAVHSAARTYRIRMSAYVGSGAAVKRYEYPSLSVLVPRIPASVAAPLVRVRLADLLSNTAEVMAGGTMYAVEAETVRAAPQYKRVTSWTTPASISATADYPGIPSDTPIDPFEMKVTDANLGVLLFSPAAREGVVSRPGGVSEPLIARVDYDVRDWRILVEDFRIVDGNGAFSTSLQSLKVGNGAGPDGKVNGGLLGATSAFDPTPSPRDNVVVVDLATGFEVQRYLTDDQISGQTAADSTSGANDPTKILVSVDKSRGSLTLRDADTSTTRFDVRLIPPPGAGAPILVDGTNRPLRVLYRARQEWAVQTLKGASQYTLVNTLPTLLAPDQAFVGQSDGSTGTAFRIYFPVSEVGHKVTIDRIAYTASGVERVMEGQDFVIRPPKGLPALAYADLRDADGNATAFSYRYGLPVRGIKGASVSVRVLWNPESFVLSNDGATNIRRVDEWGRSWRRSTTETYLRAEETR